MTRARKVKPEPASSTMKSRPAGSGVVTSPRPRVRNVEPLMYSRVPNPTGPEAAWNRGPSPW